MKKICSFLLFCSLFFGSCNLVAENEEVKPYSKSAPHIEGAIYALLSGLSAGMVAYSKIGDKSSWGRPAISIVAGVLGAIGGYGASYFGFTVRRTDKAYLYALIKVLAGSVSDPKLLDELKKLVNGSAIKFVDQLVEKYGLDESQNSLNEIEKELEKAKSYALGIRGGKLSLDDLQKFETVKKALTSFRSKLDLAKKLVGFRKAFVQADNLVNIGARSIGNFVDKEGGAIILEFEKSYGGNESPEYLEQLSQKIKESRKELFEKRNELRVPSVEKEKFSQFMLRSAYIIKEIDSVVMFIKSHQLVKRARTILKGKVSEPTLFNLMKEQTVISVNDVVNMTEKYGFLKALERLEQLDKELEANAKELVLAPGKLGKSEEKKIRTIQNTIQQISAKIVKSPLYKEQYKQKLREMGLEIEREKEKNKRISLINEKKRLIRETKKYKMLQENYKYDVVLLKKEKQQLKKETKQLEKKSIALQVLLEKQKEITIKARNIRKTKESEIKKNAKNIKELRKQVNGILNQGMTNKQPACNPEWDGQ